MNRFKPSFVETNDKSLFYEYFDKYSTSRDCEDKYKISWHLLFMPEIYYVTTEDLKHAMKWANAKVNRDLI